MNAQANPSAYTLAEWWDLDDARTSARKIAQARRGLEQLIEDHIKETARLEGAYDTELAKRVDHHRGAGKGAGEAEVLAKGDVARHKQDREQAREILRLMFKKLDALDGERAVFRQFCDWSARLQERQAA